MIRLLSSWFVGGFLVTFLVLAAVWTTYTMLPNGNGVIAVPLWRYYAHEWPRVIGPSTLGPGSANQVGLLLTTLQHVALSVLGGIVASTVAWWFQRRSVKHA